MHDAVTLYEQAVALWDAHEAVERVASLYGETGATLSALSEIRRLLAKQEVITRGEFADLVEKLDALRPDDEQ